MKEFERKEKQVDIQKKIAFSNEVNKSRLRVLKSQEEGIQEILNKAKTQLANVSKDKSRYKDLLKKLIAEGAIKLEESKILIRCRTEDKSLVDEVLSQVQQEVQQKAKRSCQFTVDTRYPLPAGPTSDLNKESCTGGVILSANEGRIMCNNTLDIRLQYAFEGALPEVRRQLYGDSHI